MRQIQQIRTTWRRMSSRLAPTWRQLALRWRVASCVAGIVIVLASSFVVALNVPHAAAATKPHWPKIDAKYLPPHGHVTPTKGQPTASDYLNARAQVAKLPSAKQPPAANRSGGAGSSAGNPSGGWRAVNPGPVSFFGSVTTSGTISSIAVDPTTSGANTVIYLGTYGGGVWKSINNGQSWFALSDNQVSLQISAVALDPTNPNTIYAATAYPYNGYTTGNAVGILKSTNGGGSWTLTGTSTFSTGGNFINQIAVDPNSNQHIFVATQYGPYLSTDGGSTYNQIASLPHGNSNDAVVINGATNPSTIYEAIEVDGIYKSTDGGSTFPGSPLGGGLPAGSSMYAIGLAMAPTNPNVLYATLTNNYGDVFEAGGYNGGYYTTNGGTSWSQMNSLNQNFSSEFPRLLVDPKNDQILYGFGGTDLFVSTAARAGSGNWQNITNAYGYDNSVVPPQQNALAFSGCTAAPCPIYTGTEFGIYASSNPTAGSLAVRYTSLNTTGLAIENMGGGAIGPNYVNGHYALASSRLGTILYNGSAGWPAVGYNGGDLVIDQTNTSNVYAQNYCYPNRSLDGGITFSYAGGVGSNYINGCTSSNLSMDASHDTHLVVGTSYYNGSNSVASVYETGNGGWTWYQGSQQFPTANDYINAVAIAPANSHVIYAGFQDGQFWRTTTGYSNSQQTYTQGASLPGYVTSITVDPTDATGQTVYATTSYPCCSSDTANIFKSSNGGGSWTNITGSLPAYPVYSSVAYHSGSALVLIVASDYGVAYTADDGAHWTMLSNGLPNVSVIQISLDAQRTTLMAFTNGRGAWSMAIPETTGGTGDTVGIVFSGSNTFYLRNALSGGPADETVTLGSSSMTPLAGDWNGDGVSTVGVYDGNTGTFYLTDSNSTGAPINYAFPFGPGGNACKPLVGDWTGKGSDSIGIDCSGTFYLRNNLSGGGADYTMTFGLSSDVPVAGDWSGQGRDSIGIYRPSSGTFALSNAVCNCTASANYTIVFGPANAAPLTGDWTHAGHSGIGVQSGGVFYLRNDATSAGSPDFIFAYGASGEKVVAGHWI